MPPPSASNEIEFDPESAHRYAAAGDELVLRARAQCSAEIPRKLGLTQTTAARPTGGGHNAFSPLRERRTVPLPAVMNLFKLPDKHPEP